MPRLANPPRFGIPTPAFALAQFYQVRMTGRTRDAVTTLLAFQAHPSADLEPVFKASAIVRSFWSEVARPVVVDTERGEVLSSVSAIDEENNPGRYIALSVEDQAPAVLGHSLAWILA